MEPLVSVIVPAYNAELFLHKCLDSILSQLLKDIEIIVISDGSTDATNSIISDYAKKDSRVKGFKHINQGLGATRNAGLKLAKGKYVCFVDADDWIAKDFLLKLYQQAYLTEADIAMGNVVRAIPEGTDFTYRDFVKVEHQIVTDDALEKYRLTDVPRRNYVVNKLYNRQALIDNNLWFETGVAFEDIEWSTKVIYLLDKLVTVKNANYYYRYNTISLMIGDSEKGYEDYHRAQQKALKFRQSIDLPIENIQHYEWTTKTRYRLFGITILLIETYMNDKLYYLLGKWLIAVKKRRLNDKI